MPIPLRPRATPDVAVVEWVTSALPAEWATQLPTRLAALVDDGVVERVGVDESSGTLVVRLAAGHTWRQQAPTVRAALLDDLWDAADASLERAARELADGPLLRATNAHGGAINVERVHRGVVEVTTHGACHGCPAVQQTLGQYFRSLLEERGERIEEVRELGQRPVPTPPC